MAVLKIGRRPLAAAVGVLMAGTMACGATHSTPHAEADRPSSFSGSTAAPPTVPSGAAARSFCPVANPAALTRAETAGAISHAAGETLVPAAVAPDASSFFALDGAGVRNLKNLVWVRGGKQQTVFTLAAPYAGYGVVGFDGRWLVFMADRSQEITGAWDLYAWDSRGTAKPRVIASDPGTEADSPVEWPRVHGGEATWIQGTADGTQQVHLYDLATGHDHVVHTGHLGASLFAGDLLVWTEAVKPDGPVTLAAVSVATGAPAPLPAPLAQAQTTPATVASDGTTWAWTSADYRTLYAWRAGSPAAVTVRTADDGDAMDSLGVSGDLLTWTSSKATFAANLKTGSFTQVTKEFGSALTNGNAVAVYYPLGDLKSPDLTYDGYVVKTSDISELPRC
ncbi:hypothetical protein [Catenulispora subtropica]|uniref:WD40 domain protein beta Propeller n=1 Tax=Catenulispora subtropica TaxID=450798 RepID=A0ABN2QCD2_9ACTN